MEVRLSLAQSEAGEAEAGSAQGRGIQVVVLMLHGGCNMDCTFCINDPGMQSFTQGEAGDALVQAKYWGAKSVVLGGGEPFAWRGNLVGLACQAQRMGLVTQVGTNGLALPAGYESLTCFDRWVMPIESSTAGSHDRMRLAKRSPAGHYAVIVDRLESLGRARRSVTLSTVLTKENVGGLDGLAAWIGEYHGRHGNVHAWHLYQFIPLGRGGATNWQSLSIAPEEYQEAARRIQGMRLPFRVYRREEMPRSRVVEFLSKRGGKVVWGDKAWDPEMVGLQTS